MMDFNSHIDPLMPLSNCQPRRAALPEEILEKIVKYLSLPDDCKHPTNAFDHQELKTGIRTLASICLASTTMNRIAEPVLYETLCVPLRPQRLLAALYARSHRVEYVRELIIPRLKSTDFSPDPFSIDANLTMLDNDRTASTLLRLCTAVESLDFTIDFEFSGSRTERVMEDIGSEHYNGPLLQTLNRVVFRGRSAIRHTAHAQLATLFPHVEEKVFHELDRMGMLEDLQELRGQNNVM